jgi:hypothetical protein
VYSGRGLSGILLGIFLARFSCLVSGRQEKSMLGTLFNPVHLLHHTCVLFTCCTLE